MKKNKVAFKGRSIPVAALLIVVVLLSAGSGLYAGSFFAQQAPNVTVTTTIFTTTTSWTTSTILSTLTETVQGVLTIIELTTSTNTVTMTGPDSKTMLLLHMDGTDGSQTFIDSSRQARIVTAGGNARISSAQSRFGGTSGQFGGAGDYLSTPNNADFDFGTGNWAVDFWIRRNGSPAIYGGLVGAAESAGLTGWAIVIDSASRINVFSKASGSWTIDLTSTLTVPNLTWTHIAVVRNGNALTIYFDGVAGGSKDVTGYTYNSGGTGLNVGRMYTNLQNYYAIGWLDEIRVSKGVARWTSNFTPPATPY